MIGGKYNITTPSIHTKDGAQEKASWKSSNQVHANPTQGPPPKRKQRNQIMFFCPQYKQSKEHTQSSTHAFSKMHALKGIEGMHRIYYHHTDGNCLLFEDNLVGYHTRT